MKKNLFALGIVAIVATTFAFTTKSNNKYFEISKNIEIFTNIYKELNTWYVDELDPATVMKQGIDAMLGSLDPYTNYFSESQIESYRYQSDSKYEGIGADVRLIDGMPTIADPYEDSPAIKAGLKAGDQVLEINGQSTSGRSAEEVKSFMRGVPGTDVQLRVKRPGGDEVDVTMTRGAVKVPNVPYSGFVADGIGYIALTTFTHDAGRNVSKAFRNLKTENPAMKGLIFDLRGNGGGLLREAVNVSNVFIPKGEEVVSTRGKAPERDQSYGTKNNPVDDKIPLIILINGSSASASEIVSGVIQDLDRGVLVGTRSYGKGLVQNTRDIGYNAQLKLTTAKYYIPSGRCIQSVEYENGEPKHIPDSERAKFTTRNGRTVLDGGGVKPDVTVDEASMPEIVQALEKQGLIFNYVTQFCQDNSEIDSIDEFSFDEFDKFVKYVVSKDFTYTTSQEKALNKLSKSVGGTEVDKDTKAEISALRKTIEDDKKEHMDRYEDEIVRAIEMDIAGRYYYENGKTRQRLKYDPELQKAIELIGDQQEYKKILGGS